MKRLSLYLLLVGILLFAGCSQQSDGSSKCTVSRDCARGTVCVGGKCESVECATAKECAANYENTFCWIENGVCTAIECLPAAGLLCDQGYECKKQLCIESTPACTSNSQCKQPAEKCYNGQCKLKDYCMFHTDCPSGVCLFESSSCQPVEGDVPDIYVPPEEIVEEVAPKDLSNCPEDPSLVKPWDYLCMSCKKNDDCLCGIGVCSTIGSGKFCTKKCTEAIECPSGYACDSGVCKPVTGECSGCIPPGSCADDVQKVCNFQSGACVYKAPHCEPCQNDYECGFGNRCHAKEGESAVCVPECNPENFSCPLTSGCKQRTDGVYVCVSTAKTCCYGMDCDPCGCVEPTPICCTEPEKYDCQLQECYQCLTSIHCPAGKPVCDYTTHTCVIKCQPPLPVYWKDPATGKEYCVECIKSTDCPAGLLCGTFKNDPVTYHKCYEL